MDNFIADNNYRRLIIIRKSSKKQFIVLENRIIVQGSSKYLDLIGFLTIPWVYNQISEDIVMDLQNNWDIWRE